MCILCLGEEKLYYPSPYQDKNRVSGRFEPSLYLVFRGPMYFLAWKTHLQFFEGYNIPKQQNHKGISYRSHF
jgi:hypothetical protein